MKLFKKSGHCLFVEEETYNWAPVRSTSNRAVLSVLVVSLVVAVGLLTQLG